jgi:molybdate transport system regulatory protein
MTNAAGPPYRLRSRLRVLRGKDIVLGPGKADLLDAIAQTGELRAAAKELSMSYMRAWKLLQMMNTAFREPLVATERGGARHGSAVLTGTGRKVLALYRQMERSSLRASGPAWLRLRRLLLHRNT